MIQLLLSLAFLSTDPAPAARLWWGDWNGDGRLDVVRSAPGAPARLLENRGDGAFVDVSSAAGWPAIESLGQVAFTDLDGDGAAELALVTGGRVRLFTRHGDGLVEGTEPAGLGSVSGVIELRTIDVDGDGLPELWLTLPEGERVLRRTPGGVFEELDLGLPLPPEAVTLGPLGVLDLPETESPDELAQAGVERPGAASEDLPGSASSGTGGALTRTGPASTGGRRAAPVRGSLEEQAPGSPLSLAFCGTFLRDSSTGNCLQASTVPTLGDLFPLTTDLNVALSGLVGIGTAAPTHKLTVEGSSSNDVLRLIGTGTWGEGARLNFGDDDYVHIAEVSDDKLEITAVGGTNFTDEVGIGTPDPAFPLDVTAYQAVGRFKSSGHPNGSVIELGTQVAGPSFVGALNFVNNLGQTKGQIAYTGGDDLTFKVNNVERVRIQADGDVVLQGPLWSNIASVSNAAYFNNQSTAQYSGGVDGTSNGPDGSGVLGACYAPTGSGKGVLGVTASPSGYGVFSIGDFGGTGAKYFVQPHPVDAAKEIRFACLEGNESGTYFRGRARTAGGQAVIDVPEDFRLVTEAEGLTVQTTPIGAPAVLWIESQGLDRIVVRSNVDVEFSYFANGVRRGFAGLETVRDNAAFVPRERGVPYGTQYRDAYRRILVENGTLNPDFTPNEATAARLGWALTAPAHPAPEAASDSDCLQHP